MYDINISPAPCADAGGKRILLAFAEAKKTHFWSTWKVNTVYLDPKFCGPWNCGNCFQKLASNIGI